MHTHVRVRAVGAAKKDEWTSIMQRTEDLHLYYRVTHQVVPKLYIQGCYYFYIGPELRDCEQPDVSPCMVRKFDSLIIVLL